MRSLIQIILALALSVLLPVNANEGPSSAAVASAHPLATRAGEEILSKGGNAFDAAVAVSAALAVVEPNGSGLGGGGFWLLHRASDGMQTMVDGREKAPALAHERLYQDEDGNIIKRASVDGPLAAGIPGVPAGLVYLANNYGRLPLGKSLAPAIAYASKGFKVTERYRQLVSSRLQTRLSNPETAAIFLDKGGVPEAGFLLVQKDLANTRSVDKLDFVIIAFVCSCSGNVIVRKAL
jgi:gamma-glutamyltranspeptidase/glutathione hydrolase